MSDGMGQWRLSWQMWVPDEPAPRWVEKITSDEEEARDQMEGLLSMVAPHELRPCGEHVWMPTLEHRAATARVFNVYVCPGCGWMSGQTAHCCGQPQCRVETAESPTGSMAMSCEAVPFVAVADLPEEVAALVLDSDWTQVAP